jgi:branched-chain amino acid transport system substrate-binding protein
MSVHQVWRRTFGVLACALTLALTLASMAAGGASAADSGRRDLGHGVSKDEIKVGIAILDYDSIADFVEYERGDQEQTAQVFVDAINKAGGIDGRTIVPYFKTYPPIPGRTPNPLSLCTSWTEDDDVFAVLGVFIDPTGQGQLCIAKEHETVHIGHQLNQAWIDEAPPGLLLTPDSTRETNATVLIDLLTKAHRLDGRKVAVLTDQSNADRANQTLVPALKAKKVNTADTSVLSITGSDTTAAQSQLESFIERWKQDDVDTVLLAGSNVSAKQFIEPIRAALPKVMLLSDTASGTLAQAQDEVAAGKDPNPYQGLIGIFGITDQEQWANRTSLLHRCVDTYEQATGKKVPGPDSPARSASGKRIDLVESISDFCTELEMFKAIAERVGPDLTVKNWQKAVDRYGTIDLVNTPIASLCTGKYAANDARRLVAFDAKRGPQGDWKKITPLADVSDGKCAKQVSAGSR